MEADDLLCSRNARPEKDVREQQTVLLARRTRTIGMRSLDARSERSISLLPLGKLESRRPSSGLKRVWRAEGGGWNSGAVGSSHHILKVTARCGLAWEKACPRAKSLSWQTQGGRVK